MARSALLIALTALLAQARADTFAPARVVLETHCLSCHYPGKVKGDLRMTSLAEFLEGGDSGPALVAQKPEESLIFERVCLDEDHDDLMPPKGGPLEEDQIASLKAWIAEGAPWPEGVTMSPRPKTALPEWNAPRDPGIERIEAFPKHVTLETAADFHRVIVLARFKDAATHDITKQAKLTLADPALAKLADTTLLPLKDGKTTLKIDYRGLSTEVEVAVKDAEKPRPVSFQLDVMPVLTSAGCNTGSCHGSAQGQDGFHLTLYGYDPKGDHFRLTEEMPGRRINYALPERSLLLTKATGEVPHTAGKLFDRESTNYQTLLRWIEDGAKFDHDQKVEPTGITIEPAEVVLKGPDIEIPFTVRATYSDGTDRDVSTLSTFTTSNDNSASIGELSGIAESKHRGEAFLLSRFHTFTEGSQAIVVPKDLPYTKPDIDGFNYIDDHIHQKLHKLRVIPSDVCSDEVFVRRVHIDLIGRLPSVEERAAFLADTRGDKRAQLIDALIERPEFTRMWVMKWSELLQIRTFRQGPNQVSYKAALGYHGWLRDRIASHAPFDTIVRELLSSTGGTFSSPATNYFQTESDVLKLTENVAQVFMGTRIQCAQCHNHPFDRWTMDDYYGFAAFFAQVKRKRAEDPRERIVFDGGGEVKHPVTKQNSKPRFLGTPTPDEFPRGKSRRQIVAEWLTSAENPWFAKNVANIVWEHFLGVGITTPVDDVRISNPPSNPALLDALARNFIESDHDIRALVRDICNSRTYQLSTITNETNATDQTNFSHALVRRMRAEVLLDVISQVTETPNKFKGLPRGASAVEIADGNISNYFLKTFGRASRATVCSCEVKMEPNLSQALHLLNGDATHNRIQRSKVIENRMKNKESPGDIVRHLYLLTLGRDLTEMEMVNISRHFDGTEGDPQKTRAVLNDLFWALLNSKEFSFNH